MLEPNAFNSILAISLSLSRTLSTQIKWQAAINSYSALCLAHKQPKEPFYFSLWTFFFFFISTFIIFCCRSILFPIRSIWMFRKMIVNRMKSKDTIAFVYWIWVGIHFLEITPKSLRNLCIHKKQTNFMFGIVSACLLLRNVISIRKCTRWNGIHRSHLDWGNLVKYSSKLVRNWSHLREPTADKIREREKSIRQKKWKLNADFESNRRHLLQNKIKLRWHVITRNNCRLHRI